MASIIREVPVNASARAVWDAVRDVGAIHTRLCPGMVLDTSLEAGAAVRVVTFEDGLVLRERILAVDNSARRLAWSVVDGPFEHHSASVVVIGDDRRCRVVWTADLLPDALGDTVAAIMERGLALTKQTQEAAASAQGIGADVPASDAHQHVFRPVDRPTLHHVSLFVSDLEESARFYTSGLGLTRRKGFQDIVGRRADGELPFGVASVFLEAGDGWYVELHPAGHGDMSEPGFPLNHLALGVADVDVAYARALDAGATAFDIPVPNLYWDGTPLDVIMTGDRPEPMRMAFVLGPSRELIELYHSRSPS